MFKLRQEFFLHIQYCLEYYLVIKIMWYKFQVQVHITRLFLSSQIYIEELKLRKVVSVL